MAANRWSAAPTGSLRIPERTLPLLRDLVKAQVGLYYDDARLHFLRDRLVPLAVERGFDSLLDYYYLLRYDADASREWIRAVDALSVQETYFWREADQLRALAKIPAPPPPGNRIRMVVTTGRGPQGAGRHIGLLWWHGLPARVSLKKRQGVDARATRQVNCDYSLRAATG